MSRRILLIDADSTFQARLVQLLGRYPFEIVVEEDPAQAVAAGTVNQPALIVVAVEEPDKAGFKLFQKLKKGALGKTPIALVTATVPAESFAKHRGLKVHADEYFDKRTISDDELLGRLDNLIELGDPLEEELDIPVEVDDIALSDGDMVLEETIGEDTLFGDDGQRVDSMVDAETEAAFDALLGFDEVTAAPLEVALAAEAAAAPIVDEPIIDEAIIDEPIADEAPPELPPAEVEAIPGMILDGGRSADLDDHFDSFSQESARPPITQRSAFESSPAIPIDEADLEAIEDDSSGGVPEPVVEEEAAPEPIADEIVAAADIEEEVTIAPAPAVEPVVEPAAAAAEPDRPRAKLIDAPTNLTTQSPFDLGLDAVAEDADREQSGVYDRRALRKIHELERQLAQLKAELDRARAAADAAAKGTSRANEFIKLKEQIIAKDQELLRLQQEGAGTATELTEAQEKVRQLQHARTTLEAKNRELEQRLIADASRSDELAARERALAGQLAAAQQEAEARGQALAATEARAPSSSTSSPGSARCARRARRRPSARCASSASSRSRATRASSRRSARRRGPRRPPRSRRCAPS